MAETTIEIEVAGRSHRVAVERLGSHPARFRVAWGGVTRVVDALRIDPETLSLVLVEGGSGSHAVRCVDAAGQGTVDVHVDGAVVRALVDVGRARFAGHGVRGGEQGGGRHVTAPMPGKVVRLLVAPGDEVEARQGVVVIEAMKMENELTAPRAGRVAEVAVEEGASVETGKVLVVLE
jgi:biotin carboxyl carrier protein